MTELRTYQHKRETETSEQYTTSTSSTTSTTTMAHGAGRILPPMELETIRTAYNEILGSLNAIKARDIERAFEYGLDTSAILDALEQTAYAPRPSHAYFRAIIRRYALSEIYTAEDAEEDRRKRKMRQERAAEERDAWFADPVQKYYWDRYGVDVGER